LVQEQKAIGPSPAGIFQLGMSNWSSAACSSRNIAACLPALREFGHRCDRGARAVTLTDQLRNSLVSGRIDAIFKLLITEMFRSPTISKVAEYSSSLIRTIL
jgi:hypothetical protein